MRNHTLIYIVSLMGLVFMFKGYFGLAVNVTHSLPYKVFVIHKVGTPAVGKYISFKAPAQSGFSPGTIITKKIWAGPGDRVLKKGQDFYINQKWVSRAKPYSRAGELLITGPEGQLPPGQYYVGATHPDSLDSRYQKMGWINSEQIIAVAYPLF